ncbi:hypothetical protein B0A53_01181 [Rhodotorula sp. CCFEE 5036]|nr:hypothetical protein B0A53_01181 [Rhodotorula sp. CCFEE 5036]
MDDLVNIIASSPDDYVSIVSLSPSAGFTLSDGLVVPSPILMIDGNCFMWDVGHPTDGTKPDGKPKSEFGLDWDGWSKDKLAVFETLSPRPEIILFGTGAKGLFAPPAVRTYLNGLGIQVDVLDSRNASSTFNLLQEEGRRVAAALQPYSTRLPIPAKMSSQPLLQRPRDKRIALPVRVEPKVFFANERTFLSWLSFSVVLGGLAVGLLNFGDRVGKISAGMFTLVAMGMMLYALVTFHWRANAIRKRGSGPYDDRLGPTVLCLSLFAAVITNFILRFAA